ncbi:hypothetical protein ES703_120661 [subsurface metagenome]
MKTFSEWGKQKGDFSTYVNPGDEIDEEMYWYFLEVLPPRIMKNYGFLVGEPSAHNKKDEAVYDAFYESPDGKRFYYGGLKTAKEFVNSSNEKYTL